MNRKLAFAAIFLLAILHHDFWWWNDATLVFGFLPISLAYHALYCCVSALVWFLAAKHVWPDEQA